MVASRRRAVYALIAALGLGFPVARAAPAAAARATGRHLVTRRTAAADLPALVDRFLTTSAWAGCHVGVVVRRVDDGTVLVARDADGLYAPASLEKVVTAEAALRLLGPERRFLTTVLAAPSAGRPRVAGVLDGDLVLRGGGDPALSRADLTRLAADVAASGVRRITGDLVVDATAFAPETYPAGWMVDDLGWPYAAPTCALTVDGACVPLRVQAGAHPGDPATVQVDDPSGQVRAIDAAVTGAGGPPLVVTPLEGAGAPGRVRVAGAIATADPPVEEAVAVPDPATLAGACLAGALRSAGIAFEGTVRRGTAPPDAVPVAAHASAPLAELVKHMAKTSDNAYAETLLLDLATPSASASASVGVVDRSAGLAALGGVLGELGWNPQDHRIADGSGLSRYDLVSPGRLADLLVRARRAPEGEALREALPTAAVDGTLAGRFHGTPLAGVLCAKTGTMSGVSGLAGYLEAPGAPSLVVVVMVNGFVGPAAPVQAREDELVTRIGRALLKP